MKNIREIARLCSTWSHRREYIQRAKPQRRQPARFRRAGASPGLQAISTQYRKDGWYLLHAYFILPGDIELPIVFEVDRIRDGAALPPGASKAIQKGTISICPSFQKKQEGFDHQISMPNVTPPDGLMSWDQLVEEFAQAAGKHPPFPGDRPPHRVPPGGAGTPMFAGKRQPQRHVWMRTKGEMPDDNTRPIRRAGLRFRLQPADHRPAAPMATRLHTEPISSW